MQGLTDYVMNTGQGMQGYGEIGSRLSDVRFDPGLLRPFLDENRRACVTVNTGRTKPRKDVNGHLICNRDGVPVEFPVYETHFVKDLVANGIPIPTTNATTLRKNEWIELDATVLRVFRKRLRAWADLADSATYNLNGMSKSMVEWETMSDPGSAIMDMDGTTSGRDDAAVFGLEAVPLPITHSDFSLTERKLMESRNGNTPLDLVRAESAARRVAELIEKHTIGTAAAFGPYGNTSLYGTSPKVYGYTNYPNRQTYTSVTTPTGSNPQSTVSNVLAMIDLMYAANHFGPFMLYYSNDWSKYMGNDYAFTNGSNWAANPSKTLKQRLLDIEGIQDVRRLDMWTPVNSSGASLPYQLLLVEMTTETARAIVGLPPTTVQWDTMGGLRKNFKVMTIAAPNMRVDYNSNCGVVHGTTA